MRIVLKETVKKVRPLSLTEKWTSAKKKKFLGLLTLIRRFYNLLEKVDNFLLIYY